MARKLKLMSLFQELSGRAAVTNRRPVQPSSGMNLMQLRPQSNAIPLPRRRFVIEVDLRPAQPLPAPVKINHVRPENPPIVPLISSTPLHAPVTAGKPGVPQVRSEVD